MSDMAAFGVRALSITTTLTWSLLRALAIALVAVLVAQPVCSHLLDPCVSRIRETRSTLESWRRRLLIVLVVAPWLTPSLLVGYAYSNFSLQMVHHTWASEVLYALLLAIKLVPIAVAVFYFAPSPPLTSTARFCRKLVPKTSRMARRPIRVAWSFAIHGPMRANSMAFVAVFLLSFQEFEMAALFGTRAWTVSLFDAQVGGFPLHDSLAKTLIPVLFEAMVLGLGLMVLLKSRHAPNTNQIESPQRGRLTTPFAWVYLMAAFACVCLVPVKIVLRGTIDGLGQLLRQFTIATELGSSVLFAIGSTVLAILIARWCVPGRQVRLTATLSVCLPGLLGALVLSLSVLAVFQLPLLSLLYDTPLPLLITLTLLLTPLAVLLRLLLERTEPGAAIHLVKLLGNSPIARVRRAAARLRWHMHGRTQLCVVMLLFILGYFDLLASALLAPSAFIPATMRMYNQMHYGHSTVLSAMVCVMVVTPIVLLAVLWLVIRVHRWPPQWFDHG